ncbi:sigma-54-dependent transcriptional regulator [Paraurantiacibacter namhicola]|uniref:DNA-binding transcriptional regulator NtrC n=1 Tax=Paraurantiacibacter namhicola TaxID=645517 RepID=A0A1C7D8Z0_9SPHN|nr:sigma-54 dependent transcriptional regulator [Paraurantiacibacter namhicola]ANU07956.1 Nitrogen assimilation regulatory protein [Paraurantiacibacter namhicola]
MTDPKRILLVEDDRSIATVIAAALQDEGFAVSHCSSIAERDAALSGGSFNVMLTDVRLGDGDGIESLAGVQDTHPAMPIIVLSAQNTLDTAVRATGSGAFEYFPKPFDLDELVAAVRQAAERAGPDDGEGALPNQGLPLIGRSPPMQDVYRMITRVLQNDLSVLVLGESGTGKELVAEAIHQLGHRKTGPFVALNTAAIPRDLVESELFGHEKGAFTGAVTRNIGKFELARGGTLFLDEIGDMPPDAQTRLLRALQTGRIRRVGGQEEIRIDCRIIAATNRDLSPMIADGRFREDLYYRINVVPIRLPALRDRREDIPDLARHFLQEAEAEGLPRRYLPDDGAERLSAHRWPGNVRELRNFMLRAALLAREDNLGASVIAPILQETTASLGRQDDTGDGFEAAVEAFLSSRDFAEGEIYHAALAAMEKPLISRILSQTHGNQLKAARLLGINRNTLRKKLTDLGIDLDRFS